MFYFNTFAQYIEAGGREYRPYFEGNSEIEINGDNIRLYRRSLNIDVPQLATAFRGIDIGNLSVASIATLSNTVKLPDWYSKDPFDFYRKKIEPLDDESPDLPGCFVPKVDRMQSVYMQRAYGVATVWLSATYDEYLAKKRIWPHMHLMALDVPMDRVLPVAKVIEATDKQIGYKDTIEVAEVGIFGGIKKDWIVGIEPPTKKPPHVLRAGRVAQQDSLPFRFLH